MNISKNKTDIRKRISKYPSTIAHLAKVSDRKQLKMLPIALVQVKADHTAENLLNVTGQIIYSLNRAKEITKKVHNI